MSSDRERRHLRVSVRLRVRAQGVHGEELLYFTRNVSVGGLFLLMQPPLKGGSLLDMAILTGDGEIEVRGQVVRTEEFGCAFEFIGLSAEAREDLRRLVSNLLNHSVATIQSIAHSRIHERATTYWAKDAEAVPVRITKLSEDGAHFEGDDLPELYDRIRVYLPAEDRVDLAESPLTACSAQVIDRRSSGFSVVFLEHRPDFMSAIHTMLQPPRQVIH